MTFNWRLQLLAHIAKTLKLENLVHAFHRTHSVHKPDITQSKYQSYVDNQEKYGVSIQIRASGHHACKPKLQTFIGNAKNAREEGIIKSQCLKNAIFIIATVNK